MTEPYRQKRLALKLWMTRRYQYTLKAPCPYFVDLVSMQVYFPVQKATIEANGDKWTASAEAYVSNGPFKVTQINMGESYVLEKNDNYWDAENVTLEKLTYRYILDLSTALTAFENNEVDGVRMVSSGDYCPPESGEGRTEHRSYLRHCIL